MEWAQSLATVSMRLFLALARLSDVAFLTSGIEARVIPCLGMGPDCFPVSLEYTYMGDNVYE